MTQDKTLHTTAAFGRKTIRGGLFRTLLLLLLMMAAGGGTACGQEEQEIEVVDLTTDTDNSGTIDEGEKKLYLIQTNAFPSFYMVPQDNNTITTNNIPGDYMLWYFLDAGKVDGTQYYYLVNNSTGKYVYNHNGNSRGISLITSTDFASLTDANKEKCKFKFELNTSDNTSGFYNINVKANQTYYGLNKQSGSMVNTNPIRLTNTQYINDVNSKWKFIAKSEFSWDPPFTLSTDSNKHFYKIRNVQSNTYYVSTDETPDKVTYASTESDGMVWCFKEVASDSWFKYYYIINPSSGNRYMHYDGTATNGNDQTNAVSVKEYDSADEDRYQFVVIQAARGDGPSRVTCYAIIPKLLKDQLWKSNSLGSSTVSDGVNMGIINSRGENNKAHWTFVPTNFSTVCSAPTITFSNTTGKATITTTTSRPTIYYTIDGTEPSSSNGTEYVASFDVTEQTTIKAIVTRAGFTDSEVTTTTIYQVATPTIQDNGHNAISITTATEGAAIYYTTDGSTPTTSSTEYTGPLDLSDVPIKAIAVKGGMINSAVSEGTVRLKCAKPVFIRSGNQVTISCAFPTSGVTIYYTVNEEDDPTTSSTQYVEGSPIEVVIGDVIKAFAVPTSSAYDNSDIATKKILDDLVPTDGKYLIEKQDDFEAFIDMANTEEGAGYHYVLKYNNVTAGSKIIQPFTGIFDGGMYTISGLTHPLFNTVDGGVVKNVMLSGVSISGSEESVGAIAGVAQGYSRIYNCGILPGSPDFPEGIHPSVSGGSYAGGIVGTLMDDSRVVNCFSYADVSASTIAAGIVGNNIFASDASVSEEGKYANLRTAVINCMSYGNVSASTVYPVYGGTKITNAGSNAINNYNYYSVGCTFTGNFGGYNCSWPAQLDYLTRYEFLRYQLNSNRELCGWWVGSDVAPSTLTTAEVQAVPKDASIMAKWVLDPSVAPYPILKPAGKYPSPVNIDADALWRESANEWEGKKLGTLSVTVNAGEHGSGTETLEIPITDMDTLRADYCYRKIQLPYYNTVFGNPDGATWAAKYGGNYTNYAVTGWDISTSEGTEGTLVENWQDGYNFADRNCTAKDTKRTFAQGGYYYVPNGVTSITITAHWGNAIYLGNGGNSYDRVDFKHDNNKPGTAFAPAGIRGGTLGNGKTVQTGKIATVAAGFPSGGTVYDNALVLVGNHQYCTGGEDVNPSRSFTIMSADFDFDNEPDYCLDWQLGVGTTRQSICPIRFDFLPVVEIGLGLKKDGSTQYYSLGCYRPLGHFEVTETALIRFGQFEFSNVRTVDCPIILNGGIFEQYTKGTVGSDNANKDKITYIIIGGNVYLPSFTPGSHVNSNNTRSTRHCAVNVLGGRIDNLYLTGNYNNNVTPNKDNPHCYIDGGRFKHVAAAGKEGIDGDVTFKVNHSAIWEFYGGSTLADKRVTGSIDVTIDNSRVTKYCGGPKFGDMYDGKTVTTSATGTTFGVYYGGGNGGTSYVQYDSSDGEQKVSGFNWGTTGKLNNYSPRTYRDEETGYMADYDLTITNVSTGTNAGNAVYRSYFYAAQFSATNTGPITNTLTNCTVRDNFYGGGNLGGVIGNVTSTLKGTTKILGSAFGAGYSASIPEVTIHAKDKTPPSIDVNTGIITPQSGGTSTTYTWTNETSLGGETLSTANPAVTDVDGKNYFFTEMPLENLGTVTGTVSFTIEGDSEITHDVYGGGNESAVEGTTAVTLKGNTQVGGSVFGGGNKGKVSGKATVNIED